MEMGKAISQKIREAIRAKLIDLGNYVDEELPDYIMVMIANKKTEEQMKDDLVLFMGANTEKFCGWLQDVLKKLQAAREEQKERKEKNKDKKKKTKKKDEKKEKKRKTSGDSSKVEPKMEGGEPSSEQKVAQKTLEGEVPQTKTTKANEGASAPAVTPEQSQTSAETAPHRTMTEQPLAPKQVPTSSLEPEISLLPDTNDFLDEEIKMSESVKRPTSEKHVKVKQSEVKKKSPKVTKAAKSEVVLPRTAAAPQHQRESSPPVIVTMGSGRARAREDQAPLPPKGSVKSRLGLPATKRKAEPEAGERTLTTLSTVVRVPIIAEKGSGPGSVVGQVIQEDEDSDDEPVAKRVASTIKPRRRPPLPKTKQNSMALLKKAMSQAQESTSVFPAAGQFTEPRRMIVRSASKSGSMKIVARSIPADMEAADKGKSAQKKMLATAVKAASQSVSATITTKQPTKQPTNQAKASVTVRPLGLMSRSRFKEANERNFDAHSYQRVEEQKGADQEEGRQEERQEEEEEQGEEENGASSDGEPVEEEKTVVKLQIAEGRMTAEGVEEEDEHADERQIIEIKEEITPKEEELIVEDEEEQEEGEEEKEMVIQEPVCDTRMTTIVRPLHFAMLSAKQNRLSALQHLPIQPSPPPSSTHEDLNPRFIVTLEGKKRSAPHHHHHPPYPPDVASPLTLVGQASAQQQPTYRPTPIGKLLGAGQAVAPTRYEAMVSMEEEAEEDKGEEEEEMEVMEEKYYEYEPMQSLRYQQMILQKEKASLFAKEPRMERVAMERVSTSPLEQQEHQRILQEALFSSPHPRIEPVAFSLQESDEEQGHGGEVEEKVNERCKFWPACKNGNDCNYMHPSAPCRTFPNCKFGDKCLFIHPNCKFDATCMNPTCPFTHATRTKPAPVVIQAPPVRPFPRAAPGASTKVCRFHPNCFNTKCPFLHPKMCRYNRSCTRPDCKFSHSTVPARSAMKWTKDQHISERRFVSKRPTSSTQPS